MKTQSGEGSSGTVKAIAAKGVRKAGRKWDKEVDIVVVGFGTAGSAAAIEAHDAGASVLLLEKMPEPGVRRDIHGGVVYCAGTSVQKAKGIEDSTEDMLKYLEEVGGELIDVELTRVMAQTGSESVDWLIRLGVDFPPELLHVAEELPQYAGLTPPRSHVARRRGVGLWEPIEKAVSARGIEVLLNTAMKQLITDPCSREVLGVETDKMSIRARRAVILSTGSFAGDKKMIRNYLTPYIGALTFAGEGLTGDGIKAAQALGADLVNMGLWHMVYGVPVPVETPAGRIIQTFVPMIMIGQLAPFILVNTKGARFADEYIYMQHLGAAIAALEDKRCFCIFDEEARKLTGGKVLGQHLSDDWGKEIELGVIKEARSIRELAGKSGIGADTLHDTVSAFNENAAGGIDPQFGRNMHLAPLKTAPYYAMEVRPSGGTTVGGVKVNTMCQVVDVFGKIIPRLYAAGATVGGRVGKYYPGGGYHTMTFFALGRIAGRSAAGEKPWG